nr:MAG TPA: hypothetical protein [Caudoviricetes sp.]DAZ54249.1 MAG TPA: hypothetical protein [Caudoviricetes sp.]
MSCRPAPAKQSFSLMLQSSVFRTVSGFLCSLTAASCLSKRRTKY